MRRSAVFALSVLMFGAAGGASWALEPQMGTAPGAIVRFFDKLTGQVEDIALVNAQEIRRGRWRLRVEECRYQIDNPSDGAVAFVRVQNDPDQKNLFSGWMLAASPGLSAVDDPRYDVWLLSCQLPPKS